MSQALARVQRWLGREELEPPHLVKVLDAVRLACDADDWRGAALLVFEHGGWTVLEDLSGCLGAIPPERWLELAREDSLFVAGYNDAIGCGELVAIDSGVILRAFVDDEQSPSDNRDAGDVPVLHSWTDVVGIVDDDPFYSAMPDEALLLMLAGPAGSQSTPV